MLQCYPDARDWHQVRFSDEVHQATSPQGSIHILSRSQVSATAASASNSEMRDINTSATSRKHMSGRLLASTSGQLSPSTKSLAIALAR
ncbi:hypothetical protein BKA66DRAFT_581870 [Pyrenochaeta sp. MPI-SDFR-AT-0127]|nr:hypothetical protein BKA66DRAFT_581870 [Pyrenochaeta sp. MPI-SDFR-AT-0127]